MQKRTRFGLLDTIESIPLETKKRLKLQQANSGQRGNNTEKYIKTTYSELKKLRDEGKLIPGSMYRITDYSCSTAQKYTTTANHRFDIIVTALDQNTLSEDAKAIKHEFEIPKTCYYDWNDVICVFKGIEIINREEYYIYETIEYMKFSIEFFNCSTRSSGFILFADKPTLFLYSLSASSTSSAFNILPIRLAALRCETSSDC